MINEELQEKLLGVFDKRYQDYNTKVLEELGNVIKQFKDLTPSQAYKLSQQLKYNTTINDLLDELSKISGLSVKDLKAILEKVAKENIGFADVYYKARGINKYIDELEESSKLSELWCKSQQENKQLKGLINTILNFSFFNEECPLNFSFEDNSKEDEAQNIFYNDEYCENNCNDSYKDCWLKYFKKLQELEQGSNNDE